MGVTGLSVVLAGALAYTVPARAAMTQGSVVSENPADHPPELVDDGGIKGGPKTYSIDTHNGIGYAGGLFNRIHQKQPASTLYTRHNLVKFDTDSGAVDPSFHPDFNRQVEEVVATADGVIVGGTFSTVDGVSHKGLVRLDTAGHVVKTFQPRLNGTVRGMIVVGDQLLVGGSFTSAGGAARNHLASLNPATGGATPFLTVGVSGAISPYAGSIGVETIVTNPGGTRAVVLGNFTRAEASARRGIAMLKLGDGDGGSVSAWYSPQFNKPCRARFPQHLRGADFSPDGSKVVLAATGGTIGFPALCDSLSQWPAKDAGGLAFDWINYTGGDSVYAAQHTGSAVYTCGHQRWMNAKIYQHGRTKPVHRGTVDRPGIAAVNPATGYALAWNPTRSRGTPGCQELLATSDGLWVGDGEPYLGRGSGGGTEHHFGLGLLPLP